MHTSYVTVRTQTKSNTSKFLRFLLTSRYVPTIIMYDHLLVPSALTGLGIPMYPGCMQTAKLRG